MPSGKGTYGSKVGRPKKKKKDGHNKAARKSEGSKLRQAIRRKVGKNRPKKKK